MAVEDCELVKKYQVRINDERHVDVNRGKIVHVFIVSVCSHATKCTCCACFVVCVAFIAAVYML